MSGTYHDRQHNNEHASQLMRTAIEYLMGTDQRHPYRAYGYGVLIDLMTNTFKHADPDTQARHNWWVYGYPHPTARYTYCFSFVDNGVGILTSVEGKHLKGKLDWVFDSVGLLSATRKLRLIMEGKTMSRTEQEERGEGLPRLYEYVMHYQSISAVTIITNDVKANLPTQEYVDLPHPFQGTFIHFELTLRPQV